jgi:cAMP-specific phosphodiesterase 4
MENNDYNILDSLAPEEYRIVRKRMIESILATDMTHHARHLASLKSKLEMFDIEEGNNVSNLIVDDKLKAYENQQTVLNICIHSADISNPAKEDIVYNQWIEMVFEEFYKQGDIEKSKGYPVSLLCDRETTNINKSQIGFINFIVTPTFDTLLNVFPEIKPYINNIKSNLKRFEELVKQENK